jgi:hypothetical protein
VSSTAGAATVIREAASGVTASPADVPRIRAREAGRAELERARAEAAALRTMANTARLLEEHPVLLHLRTIQAAGTPGTTIVLSPNPDQPIATR